MISPSDLAEGAGTLALDAEGRASAPLVAVDLDGGHGRADSAVADAAAARIAEGPTPVLVGVSGRRRPGPEPLLSALSCTLVPPAAPGGPPAARTCVEVADPFAAAGELAAMAAASPYAAVTLDGLLRLTARSGVNDGLVAESLAYSMLLAGPEFAAWRSANPRREAGGGDDAVLLSRSAATLEVTLNRPGRHNAFAADIRDGVVEAMRLAELDDRITRVRLSGRGPSFCSGGDLDEFGSTPNVAAAHLIRQRQSAGWAVHRIAEQVHASVHGACIGAGVEVPAFAGRVEAHPDAYFQLPELRMGLVPGAGGTVSITRRIGRWRTAYLALHGRPVDTDTALSWGLVDGPVDGWAGGRADAG